MTMASGRIVSRWCMAGIVYFSSLDLFDIDINRLRGEIARRVNSRDAQFFSARNLEESDSQRHRRRRYVSEQQFSDSAAVVHRC